MKVKRKNFLTQVQEIIPPDKGHVSNSLLSEVKKLLVNDKFVFPESRFYAIGSEVHRLVLEPHENPQDTFSEAEQTLIDDMVGVLYESDLLNKLLEKSKNENVLIRSILGIVMKAILDIHVIDDKIGGDLKTTSARTYNSCVKSCKKFGYFRQAHIYKTIAGLSKFYFIFVTKKSPMRYFVVDVDDFPEDMGYAEYETNVLIDAVKAAGRFNKL